MRRLEAELDVTEKLIARQLLRFRLRKFLTMSFWIQKARDKGLYLLSKSSIQLGRIRPYIRAGLVADKVLLVLKKTRWLLIFFGMYYLAFLIFFYDIGMFDGDDISLEDEGARLEQSARSRRLTPENTVVYAPQQTDYGEGEMTQTDIVAIRLYNSPEKTRVMFELDGAAKYEIFSLVNPHRIVVDIAGARLSPEVTSQGQLIGGLILGVRSGTRNNAKDARIILDLDSEVRTKHFMLSPVADFGDRLVVDLYFREEPSVAAPPEIPSESLMQLVF